MRAAGTVAVSCVAETNVVASGVPFQFTVEPETKLVPFTVNVNCGPPAVAQVGLSELIVGTALIVITSVALAVLQELAAIAGGNGDVSCPGCGGCSRNHARARIDTQASGQWARSEAGRVVGCCNCVGEGNPYRSARRERAGDHRRRRNRKCLRVRCSPARGLQR